MFFGFIVLSCMAREGIFIPNSARDYGDTITPHEECRFYGSVSHSFRLIYKDEANVDLHNRQNDLSIAVACRHCSGLGRRKH